MCYDLKVDVWCYYVVIVVYCGIWFYGVKVLFVGFKIGDDMVLIVKVFFDVVIVFGVCIDIFVIGLSGF